TVPGPPDACMSEKYWGSRTYAAQTYSRGRGALSRRKNWRYSGGIANLRFENSETTLASAVRLGSRASASTVVSPTTRPIWSLSRSVLRKCWLLLCGLAKRLTFSNSTNGRYCWSITNATTNPTNGLLERRATVRYTSG